MSLKIKKKQRERNFSVVYIVKCELLTGIMTVVEHCLSPEHVKAFTYSHGLCHPGGRTSQSATSGKSQT